MKPLSREVGLDAGDDRRSVVQPSLGTVVRSAMWHVVRDPARSAVWSSVWPVRSAVWYTVGSAAQEEIRNAIAE